ncbi:MAG: phosphatase PAP2 family protein [Polyangiaceae bacterium]
MLRVPQTIAVSAILASSLFLGPSPVWADEDEGEDDPPGLVWRYRRHHVADYVATGVFVATALTAELAPGEDVIGWRQTNPFDLWVRDTFVLGDYRGRRVAARISDATISALVAWHAVDAAIAWGVHDAPDVAWQMFALDAQAMTFTLAFTGVTKRIAARERPAGHACRTDPSYDRRCEDQGQFGSFFSGHTSLSFTSAALTCHHHIAFPLYGGGAGDVIACVSALFAASSVAYERILADRHWASDVLVGFAAGGLSGGLLPWLSFYGQPSTDVVARWSVAPTATPTGGGLSLQGLLF